jgi:fatty-acyl-CoA synthase
VLKALPLTAVGKTFKPELRLQAIEHVLTKALGEESIPATVAAATDKKLGTLARVKLDDSSQRDKAEQLLGKFAVSCEVE